MSGFALARRARSQIADIYRYSEQQWGTPQADRYVRALFAAFERIDEGEMRSKPFPPEFGVTGEFCACQSHFIYWRKQESGRTEIVAVVHQRMLQSQQVRLAFGLPA